MLLELYEKCSLILGMVLFPLYLIYVEYWNTYFITSPLKKVIQNGAK